MKYVYTTKNTMATKPQPRPR